ncbi:hypothetical protein KUA23_07220 [Pseudomonas pergaminensis]|uniref:Uncharacterized protein n=1 Tax=Pseudomonas pergaminensis TaxID=2853159 RepID=A0ABD7TQQ8_9PSED|nr:hypothetical protein [Pseudomonas pergaminensis]USW04105.1 hypothetical protein KUA23_07220 [Pseudomonas pergaminensis]
MTRFYLRFDPAVLLVSNSDGFSYGSHGSASSPKSDSERYHTIGAKSRTWMIGVSLWADAEGIFLGSCFDEVQQDDANGGMISNGL